MNTSSGLGLNESCVSPTHVKGAHLSKRDTKSNEMQSRTSCTFGKLRRQAMGPLRRLRDEDAEVNQNP